MTVAKECKAHGGVEASFTCSSCGDAFCKNCLGRTDQGQPVCLGCSIKQSTKQASSETRNDRVQRRDRVATVEAQREKAMDSKKWLVALLIIAIPVVGFELFLLNRGGPVEVTTEDVARVEVASSIVVITALNQYRDEMGQYPSSLDRLVPGFWEQGRADLLEQFEYRQISSERYELRNRQAARTEGAEEILNTVPGTLEAGSNNIGEILQQIRAMENE